jgi:GNAT superfamily N-acetyltransferase
METTHIHIQLTKPEEVHLLPTIEQSAGERFRTIPELAWIVDDGNMSAAAHLKYVLKGTSWVAEADGQLIGFLCAEVAEKELHIWELDVRQEWQGKGIGRQLMNTALDYARSDQLQAVTLTTFREVSWNEPFYHSFGFETLTAENLSPRLEQILQEEAQHGLPKEKRCAMRFTISPFA